MIMLQTNAGVHHFCQQQEGGGGDGGGGGSPEDVLYEGDVPVSEELEDRHLENFRK